MFADIGEHLLDDSKRIVFDICCGSRIYLLSLHDDFYARPHGEALAVPADGGHKTVNTSMSGGLKSAIKLRVNSVVCSTNAMESSNNRDCTILMLSSESIDRRTFRFIPTTVRFCPT